MDKLYIKYKPDIMKFFNISDISLILKDPLKTQFENTSLDKIAKEDKNKVEIFFEEFDKIISDTKYLDFVDVTKDVSDWIAELILSKDNGESASSKLNTVCCLINVNADFYVDNLIFNENVIKKCLEEGLISQSNHDLLLDTLDEDGLIIVLEDATSDQDIRNIVQTYCNSVIGENLTGGHSYVYSTAHEESPKTIPKMPVKSKFTTNLDISNIFSNSLATEVDKSYESNDDNESLDFDNIFGEFKNTNLKEILNFRPEFKSTDPEILNVRKYQQELAEYGIAGDNVLICAPTGSGKTIVVIKIVDEHFKNKLEAKVVFIVPTNSLVEQQYKQFQKYLRAYKIVQQSGGSKPGNAPLSILIPNYDIFIVTCDILKNMLESTECPKRYLSDFSMVIFDECHHCLKSHSYNKVMDYYFELKNNGSPKPQIIGITASTGTDKAKSMDSAMSSLYILCANLDCKIVATVKVNERNLTENLNSVAEEIRVPGNREKDVFEEDLLCLIEKAETQLLALFGNNTNQIDIPQDKWHDKYLHFASNLSKSYSMKSDKEIRSLADCLLTLHRALLVNNLFTKQYACVMIKELVTDFQVDFERYIQDQLRNFVSNVSQSQDPNPSLECLKQEIKTQFESDKSSRIIVFVKEIKYAKFMEEELNNANIDNVRCAYFVGTNKSADRGGCTSSTVNEVLKKFELGKINVICCTSKPEEGLDIETCNLVVRYGHVTNEISRIQSKGRARAKNSKYLLIVPHRLEWQVRKESINKFRETMMYQAIEKFQNTDEQINSDKINNIQLQRRFEKSVVVSNNDIGTSSDKIWDILCSKCEAHLCNSFDIRVVKGSSYVIVNKDTFCNMSIKELLPNSSRISCKCGFEIGILQKHSGAQLPVLQIKKIVFKSGSEKSQAKCWKEAPFTPLDFRFEQVEDFVNGN